MNSASLAHRGTLRVSPQTQDADDAAGPVVPGGVQIDHLSVRFGSRIVFDDLSLSIRRGELLTVLGRSGCGKTTLLRFIAGFIKADELSGTLSVAGHDLTHVPPHKRNLGLLFQSYALFPHLSVFENVAFGLRARRISSKEIARRVADALKLVQLGDAGHVMPAQLSGGMQQRVALARALVIEPDVLLLDEPLSALDANLRASVRSELKALHERLPNLTIICVTHDQDDALVLSDRTLLMRDGRIAQLGTPQQLYDTPNDAFVARYLGAANLLPPHVAFGMDDVRYSERERLACLRPEALRLVPLGQGQLHGAIASVEWYGAVLSVSVELDAMPGEPVLVTTQRGHGMTPEKGARVSLRYEADDVVLIRP
ncbi:2-aminoethylphosphonate ABC transport system ATP-binding subunit PhnT [bacterium M00.F.Ca.ET.228.01.1.1]|uniref:2-aminoethylphosphonate ABC transport system ATP-binding subunit PhnT n=1 Tax=Paraburkholderia phenoliruptrix TaxID=252970 RepID=UPI001091AB8F|nr:2-aminoethylphosphonate ABC transport system ATP-binding subunit PhnT [Paraburkholderia phenoliruptrix]MBW9095791.1 2-aminoethylphosphonate ABC transport system ATP-binding subunit PhnT [Paraburkholderia phenoliruptrix]TGP39755.1 2-aminoethylphosphonate ABC transport system ATP-binding subunit PhnT [bacterium M00.F.Ca.ET.228.01.1.1]TGR95596.1 2-aminoethylphosphonate ABC transport system ATP-binding subunit PhnT [bacterium M00.F.Ca.ET.191.01.1.1]TGT96584.1 2-aminoethylphosphonate ABC transpor